MIFFYIYSLIALLGLAGFAIHSFLTRSKKTKWGDKLVRGDWWWYNS